MVPEKRAQLFARGWELGNARIIGGVHFPTDVEAGRINGTLMAALMLQKPGFRADMAEARAELRKVLKLSPLTIP
jgi:acid phosphatase (class A)